MRRLLFLFLLCPAAASATSVHYDFDPGAYFYVHLWDGAPNGPTLFNIDCTSGFVDADDVLGFARIFAAYDGGEFDVSVSTPFDVGGITFDDSGDLTHVGPSLVGSVTYQGKNIGLSELANLSYRDITHPSPGVILAGPEFGAMDIFPEGFYEWGIEFTGRRESQPAAVPEPATGLLLGMAALLKRRVQKPALNRAPFGK